MAPQRFSGGEAFGKVRSEKASRFRKRSPRRCTAAAASWRWWRRKKSGRPSRTILPQPVILSRKSEAERFQDWIAEDVLPQIRRTGRYDASRSMLPATLPANAIELLVEATARQHQMAQALLEQIQRVESNARDIAEIKDDMKTLKRTQAALPPPQEQVEANARDIAKVQEEVDGIKTRRPPRAR